MSQQELLIFTCKLFENKNIPYMLTGSIVSSLQGEPRQTHDIDVVINMPPGKVHAIAQAFTEKGYFVDEASIHDALKNDGMFNMIDVENGDKVDFWILTDDDFDYSRFSRRIQITLFGIPVSVSTPEDTIIAKLKWAKLSGGSVKQITDATRVYEVNKSFLDIQYIMVWVKKLSLESQWENLLSKTLTD